MSAPYTLYLTLQWLRFDKGENKYVSLCFLTIYLFSSDTQ